ncbi:MAG TPA: HNH endonuclease signature motif containing protein [Pirellulales bacterium]
MQHAVAHLIRVRADSRCEYCCLSQNHDELPFQVDHIIARKHGGTDDHENLAWACLSCNNHKGPNIAGLDPDTSQLTRLFNPRSDRWLEHFTWDGAVLQGLTGIGRTTVLVLAINLPYRVELRTSLLAEGLPLVGPPQAP